MISGVLSVSSILIQELHFRLISHSFFTFCIVSIILSVSSFSFSFAILYQSYQSLLHVSRTSLRFISGFCCLFSFVHQISASLHLECIPLSLLDLLGFDSLIIAIEELFLKIEYSETFSAKYSHSITQLLLQIRLLSLRINGRERKHNSSIGQRMFITRRHIVHQWLLSILIGSQNQLCVMCRSPGNEHCLTNVRIAYHCPLTVYFQRKVDGLQ